MATGPFQLLVDGASINTIGATNGTWTATTATIYTGGTGGTTGMIVYSGGTVAFPHGLQVGATVAVYGVTGAAGTAINTPLGSALYTVTSLPSGTAFTFVSGTASFGTASQALGTAGFSQDLLNPVINYSGTNRNFAVYATPGDLHVESSGDGSSSSLSFTVHQDVTPAGTASANTGPWYAALPDAARVRFIDTTAGSGNYLAFSGILTNLDVNFEEGHLGTRTQVMVSDANALIDRTIVRQAKPFSTVTGMLVSSISYDVGVTEGALVRGMLSLINTAKSGDPAYQRLFNTATTSGIYSGAESNTTNDKLEITIGTLRNALDTIVEYFQAQDGFARRYYIDSTGILRYEQVSTSGVTYATAPYLITTDSSDNVDSTGVLPDISSVTPRDFTISYDEASIAKRTYFLTADTGADKDKNPDPYVRLYNDPAMKSAGGSSAARNGIILESVVDAPTVRGKDRTKKLNTFASAYFLERSKPVFSGEFTLRGAGTKAWNQYGFFTGYYQSGASATALTPWKPGQWVSISAPQFGLVASEFYRVEQVTVSFEPGSLQRIIKITFARRRTGRLANLLAGLK